MTKQKKCGKCCCNPGRIQRLPYATISNKTALSGTGAFISFVPDGQVVDLWAAAPAGLNPAATCVNGPLRSWFNASNGHFTVQETGLYEVTLTGDFDPNTVDLGVTVPFMMATRINYVNIVDESSRCLNSLVLPTDKNEQDGLPPVTMENVVTASTVTSKMVLLEGDVINFQAAAVLGVASVPSNFIFQIDIAQLSRLDKSKVEEVFYA